MPVHGLWLERGHAGAVIALQASPFLEDIVLSVADWTWALWLIGGPKTPLLRSPPAPALYTCATWSNSRPGVRPAGCLLSCEPDGASWGTCVLLCMLRRPALQVSSTAAWLRVTVLLLA